MNNNKVYIILVISLMFNLFFLGFMAGKAFHSTGESTKPFPYQGRFLPPPFFPHRDFAYRMPHHPFPGQIAPRHHKWGHAFHFPERHNHGAFKGVLCGNVDDDVRKLEQETMEKGRPLFEKFRKENKALRAALRQEFAKENLDMTKIKELFTKQTEGFINVQKNAQDALLEMVSKLPADKRSELICTADREDSSDKIRPERQHDGKPKDIRRRGY